MKLYPFALVALVAVGAASATSLLPRAPRSHASVPVNVTVGVTPRRLIPLETATIAATFSTVGPDSGPYMATLELRPRDGYHSPTATQGGFWLHPGRPLTVYWEWRAGATLPPGLYSVWVRLVDWRGHFATSNRAPAPLLVDGQSRSGA